MVDGFDVGRERLGEATEVGWSEHRHHRARGDGCACARWAVGEELCVALVEPDDRIAQVVGGELFQPAAPPLRVGLDQDDDLSLVGADVHRPAGIPVRGNRPAAQRKRIAERCERLVSRRRGSRVQQGAKRGERSRRAPCSSGGVVHGFRLVGEQGREPISVSGGDRGVEAGRLRGGDVRSHAALGSRRLGRQLVEACERLGLAVGVEPLHPRHEAIASKDEVRKVLPLEGAAAGASRAQVRPAQEERVGSQAEDIVDAVGDAVGNLEQAAHSAEYAFGSSRESEQPDGPVIGELDGRRERRGPAIGVVRPEYRRDGTRRRRGASALGAVGEELGVALVEARDGVAEAIGGEDLEPPHQRFPIDLEEVEGFPLVGGDVEGRAGDTAR